MRAALGAGLLAVFWLLCPEPAYLAVDRLGERRAGQPSAASDGLVAAAQASAAVSAKRQLAGDAAAVQYRLKQRLRRLAETMPDIGVPQELAVERTTLSIKPPGDLAPAQPEMPAGAGSAAALAGHDARDRPVAPAPLPALVARAGPMPALPAAAPEVGLEVAAIMPAAALPALKPSAGGPERRTVALLELPADVAVHEPGQRRTPTWLRNAVASVPDHRPAVAVVIDDLGLHRRGTAALNRLRAPLTLAFLPYATDLDEQTSAARAAGHELLVHVPMEPRSDDWPGPNALTSQLGPAELVSRLRSHLRSFRGFVGVNNHMGSLLTTDVQRMAILMAELRQRDLLFLDSRTTPQSVAAREAERSRVPFAERDVFIDNELDLQAVLRALAQAETIARRQGHAVAIGHPHDVTIAALQRWLPGLDARGIALVPISAIVARQSCASGLILVGNACARYTVATTAVP
jgi:uncharacterized protein